VKTNSPIFNILNIDHVVVLSHNVKKSLQFYCDVLGMVEVRRVDTVGLIQLRAGVSMIDILPARPNDKGRNIDHFALRIDPWEPEKNNKSPEICRVYSWSSGSSRRGRGKWMVNLRPRPGWNYRRTQRPAYLEAGR